MLARLMPGHAEPAVLRIRRLSRSFREGERRHLVLDAADAEVARAQSMAILGRSGSGKSTLLNLVSGIDQPDSGTIEIDGRLITSMTERERTLYRRRHIGFIYQFFHLIPTLDVEENVRLALELNGVRGLQARRRSRASLDEVGLGDRLASAPDALSGGEQQRVAIARALVHEPTLILADEPTGNLDDQTAEQVMALLRGLVRERGVTLVMATHARALALTTDRQLELRDGRLQSLHVARDA